MRAIQVSYTIILGLLMATGASSCTSSFQTSIPPLDQGSKSPTLAAVATAATVATAAATPQLGTVTFPAVQAIIPSTPTSTTPSVASRPQLETFNLLPGQAIDQGALTLRFQADGNLVVIANAQSPGS